MKPEQPERPERRPVVTRLDPDVRRAQIIAAAAKLFEQRDPNETTFEEIADAAGVSRALVYNYFGDRGGLLAAVYLHTFALLDQVIDTEVDPAVLPQDRLRVLVRVYLEFAAEHPGAWRLLQQARAIDHPAVRGARERRMARIASLWGGGAEARITACGVIGMLEAATVDWLHTRDADLDRVAVVLSDLLWSGLAGLDRHGIVVPSRLPARYGG